MTAGGSVSCTITNNDQAATLIVIKHVINDNGGSKVAADFTMNVTGTNVLPFGIVRRCGVSWHDRHAECRVRTALTKPRTLATRSH